VSLEGDGFLTLLVFAGGLLIAWLFTVIGKDTPHYDQRPIGLDEERERDE
jgi:hypothetical protein